MENQPAGMSVFEVTVVKQRPGSSVMYSIVSAQKEFQINSHTVRHELQPSPQSQLSMSFRIHCQPMEDFSLLVYL